MGFFDSIGKGLGGMLPFDLSGGIGDIFGNNDFSPIAELTGSNKANQRARELEQEQARQRAGKKHMGYYYLEQMRPPSVTPQMEARIKALEDESQPTALVADPLFQGDRAQLVHGGQQALSSVQNLQRANDNSGGFSNQGSISDIYDRLGAQMAQLGQESRRVKENKRDAAANARQSIADANVDFANAITQAKIALENEDSAMASAALQQAYAAREKIAAAEQQMKGSIIQGVGTAAGGMIGGPQGAQAGGALGKGFSPPAQSYAVQSDPYAVNNSVPEQLPYAYRRKGFGGYY